MNEKKFDVNVKVKWPLNGFEKFIGYEAETLDIDDEEKSIEFAIRERNYLFQNTSDMVKPVGWLDLPGMKV